jgi:ParB-like chromosome segregation protein Spo0J
MQPHQTHPYAKIFPPLDTEAFAALVGDIRQHGLLSPIVLHQGMVLDGVNRQAACIEAMVEPRYVDYNGDDPISFVISQNLNRRHLSESQRSMIAAELANLKAGDNQFKVSAKAPTSNTQAGRLLKVSKDSIKRAKTVKIKGTSELVKAVKTGEIGVAPAAEIAKLPPDQQNAALKLRARSRPNVSKAPKTTTVEKLNSLAWRDASMDERRRYISGIGVKSLWEAMSLSDRGSLISTVGIKSLWEAMSLSDRDAIFGLATSTAAVEIQPPEDLSIPEFLRQFTTGVS